VTHGEGVVDGLEAIDWASFDTAYGPATAVPAALRALDGDDDSAADDALRALQDSVGHEGLEIGRASCRERVS
jgi:hypothetical protein